MDVKALKNMAVFQIALNLWNCRCNVRDMQTLFSNRGIDPTPLLNSVEELGLPISLQRELNEKIYWIVGEIADWWGSYSFWTAGDLHSFVQYAECIRWGMDDGIDDERTRKNMAVFDPQFLTLDGNSGEEEELDGEEEEELDGGEEEVDGEEGEEVDGEVEEELDGEEKDSDQDN